MANSSKKSKNSQPTRAQRTLRTQQIVASLIGIIVILSMIIGLVLNY